MALTHCTCSPDKWLCTCGYQHYQELLEEQKRKQKEKRGR